MENAQSILVVMLATLLAIFLVLFIVALIKLIQLLDHLKSISEKAERIADKAENIGQFFRFTAGPIAIGRLLSNVTDIVLNHNKSRSKKHE